jgi:hypothetical protein
VACFATPSGLFMPAPGTKVPPRPGVPFENRGGPIGITASARRTDGSNNQDTAAVIATALWANIAVNLLGPGAAVAQRYDLLQNIASNVSSLERNVSSLVARGTCSNSKTC